jgi:hypothetical protein
MEIDKIVNEIWDSKKKGYNVDLFKNGKVYSYVGNNYNYNAILTFTKKNKMYKSTFPKTKYELKKLIIQNLK